MASKDSVIGKIAQANDLIKTVNSLPTNPNVPNPLVERLRSGEYQTAAVGACDSANAEQGFTTYRLAVLLY